MTLPPLAMKQADSRLTLINIILLIVNLTIIGLFVYDFLTHSASTAAAPLAESSSTGAAGASSSSGDSSTANVASSTANAASSSAPAISSLIRAYPLQSDVVDLVTGTNAAAGLSLTGVSFGSSERGNAMSLAAPWSSFIDVLDSLPVPHTVCFWMKTAASAGNNVMFSGGNSLNDEHTLNYFVKPGGLGSLLYMGYGNQGSTCNPSIYEQVAYDASDSWRHYCIAVFLGSGSSVMQHTSTLDGAMLSSGSMGNSSVWSPGGPFAIGRRDGTCFDPGYAQLQGLGIWNVALTPDQMDTMYFKQAGQTALTLQSFT